MFLGAVVFNAPKNAPIPGSMGLRTLVFESLAIAALAWLLPARGQMPSLLERASCYLLAVSFIVFGVDHFLVLTPIGALIPNWIPCHVFWIAFFGCRIHRCRLIDSSPFMPAWQKGVSSYFQWTRPSASSTTTTSYSSSIGSRRFSSSRFHSSPS